VDQSKYSTDNVKFFADDGIQ